MKNKSIIKRALTATAILALAVTLGSCKKNDVDESGSANVRVINASSSSTAQSFYLANTTVVQSGLTFGNNTGYITVNSGTNLVAQFRNEGTSTVYASNNFDLSNGGAYSVFLAGDGQQARVKVYPDDNSTPSSGKARIRFVHLSDAAPENIDVRNGSSTNLVVNLGRNNASNYVEADPGVLSLQVYATGQSTSLGTFNLAAFAAGKIYTIYITGSTTTTIQVRQFSQN